MPKSLPVPLTLVVSGHAIYVAVVAERYFAGETLPPGQVNSLVVASAIICALVTTRRPAPRCDCAAELDALRRQVRELQERPQHMYMASAPVPAPVMTLAETDPEGLGPQAIETLRHINRRLNGRE